MPTFPRPRPLLPLTAAALLWLSACATSSSTAPTAPGASAAPVSPAPSDDGWVTIFNGRDLTGWKVNENPQTFSVKDGMLVAAGPRSHLFYVGETGEVSLTNFEWKAEVMTKPGANSGMYFHTRFQDSGWPEKGYEVQVNNTHKDKKKTGGLYAVVDVFDPPAKDDEWFTQHVIVQGKRIIVKVNDKVTVDYTEPDDVQRPDGFKGRLLGSGTVAIQGHDPDSVVYYRNIQLKTLP
jgi:hypothetical protein